MAEFTFIHKYIRYLEWELVRIQHLEKSSPRCESDLDALLNKPHTMKSLRVMRKLIKRHRGPILQNPLLAHGNTKWSFDHLLDSFQEKESVEQGEIARYLCVSIGFEVCCLDLKKNNNGSITIVSTLKLLEEGFPVSMGMFKLGSRVYMIGGQEFPGFNKTPPPYKDMSVFSFLYHKYGVMGSSRDTYELSYHRTDRSLCRTYCNIIPPLNKPKLWPIVEKIGSQIHVIDSFPRLLRGYHYPEPVPSHELLNLNDLRPGWIEFPLPCSHKTSKEDQLGMYILKHIVVGERIYAISHTRKFWVFDCKTCVKWELLCCSSSRDPFYINHVAQLLCFVFEGCAVQVDDSDMFVVIVMVDIEPVETIAYLVKQTGQVLCYQRLPHFFNRNFYWPNWKVFKVGEDEKTLCTMFERVTPDTLEKFTVVSTFNLEIQGDQHDPAFLLLSSRAVDGDGEVQFAVEKDFVKVEIKNYCVYEEKEEQVSIWTSRLRVSTCCFF